MVTIELLVVTRFPLALLFYLIWSGEDRSRFGEHVLSLPRALARRDGSGIGLPASGIVAVRGCAGIYAVVPYELSCPATT